MGYEWAFDEAGRAVKTESIRTVQQTGILFAELCVKLAEPGGRIGLILPNGYLGNRGIQYLALREWLLRHTRLVGVVAFPRFTFKKSGADVSASAVFLEKNHAPLERASDSQGYRFYAGLLESVGWRVGDKKAVAIYCRDPETGKVLLDERNDPILDTDFAYVLDEMLRSPAANCFPWLLEGREIPLGAQTWSIPVEDVARKRTLILDPKRLSFKAHSVRERILASPHFSLGDVLDIVKGSRFEPNAADLYNYVEIERIGSGEYDYERRRGWELPDRAKLRARHRDIFIAHIWSCVGKWFVAATDCDDLIVTNGCTRLRLKKGKDDYWPDVAVGLCSEAFKVQMRSLATGSDGLAEVVNEDLLSIVLPRLTSVGARQAASEYVHSLLNTEFRFGKLAQHVMDKSQDYTHITPRKSHCSVV